MKKKKNDLCPVKEIPAKHIDPDDEDAISVNYFFNFINFVVMKTFFRFRSFGFIILLLAFVMGCQRDDIDHSLISGPEPVTLRSSGSIAEFESAFNSAKAKYSNDNQPFAHPLWHELDINSVVPTTYKGLKSLLVNVKNSPLICSRWVKNQILIVKNNSGVFQFYNVIYVADPEYYTSKNVDPNFFNFVGYIGIFDPEKSEVESFSVYEDEIIDKVVAPYIENDPDILEDDNIEQGRIIYEELGDGGDSGPGDENDCFSFRIKIRERISNFFNKISKGINSYGSSLVRFITGGKNGSLGSGTGTGTYGSFFWGGGPLSGGGGNAWNGNGGDIGGGGSITSTSLLCATPSNFWAQYHFLTKKNYNNALDKFLKEYGYILCGNPYVSYHPCDVSYEELLCYADSQNCFASDIPSEENFMDCLQGAFSELEFHKCMSSASPEFLEFLESSHFIDPCSGDDIDTENYLRKMCSEGMEMNEENLLKEMDGVEKIIPDQSFMNCPKLKCVYNAIAKQNNSLWCNTIANFYNFDNADLILQIGGGKNTIPSDYFTADPRKKGVTGINDKGQVVIAFNPKWCDSDQPLLIATTILHEGIHAEIWRYMKENWTLGDWPDDVNQSSSEETFKKLFELCCTSSNLDNQHNLMLEQWIDQLAKGVWEFNGKQGSPEDYKYLVIQGIWNEKDDCSTNLISPLEYSKLRDKFLNIPNYFTFDKCE